MDEDVDGCREISAERVSDGESEVLSDCSNLDVPSSLGRSRRSRFHSPEVDDDGSVYEQNLDPEEGPKPGGFNGANPLSKLFWWWVMLCSVVLERFNALACIQRAMCTHLYFSFVL